MMLVDQNRKCSFSDYETRAIFLPSGHLETRPSAAECPSGSSRGGPCAVEPGKRHAQAGLSIRGVRGGIVEVRLQFGRVPQIVKWATVIEEKSGAFPAV